MKKTNTTQKKDKLLRPTIYVLLILLIVQFIDGMVVNLFTNLPKHHPGVVGSYAPSIPWALSGGAGIALAIHVANWLLLMAIGLFFLVFSIKNRRRVFIIGSSFGYFFILIAASGGLSFLNRGGNDFDSMEMATAFILSFISYALTLYRTKNT